MTLDAPRFGCWWEGPCRKPVLNTALLDDHRHPVVDAPAIIVGWLCEQHTGFHVFMAVGPRVPQHAHPAGALIASLMKPRCFPLGCCHPLVPAVRWNHATSALRRCPKHRLLGHGLASRIDGFSVRWFGPRWAESPPHQAEMALNIGLAVRINLRGHRDVCLGSDVPRGFERGQVGQRFGIDVRCQFLHGCAECKSSAHTTASNRVLNG